MNKTSTDVRRKLTLAACCATHAVQDGLTASVYILLPILSQVFGLSFAQVGMVRAVHSGAMGLLELPSGVFSERVGQRPLLSFGLLCAGTGYFAVSMAGGFAGLLLGLCIAGCGAAFQHSLCSSLVSSTFSGPARRAALGVYNSSGDVGKLLFSGFLTTLIGAGAAWPYVAAGYGSLALAAGIGILFLLRAVRVGTPDAVSHRQSSSRGTDWGIRHRTGFITLAVIVLLDLVVQDAFLVFIGFLMLHKGVPVGIAGFAVVLTLFGGIAGKFGCGLLAARVGPVSALIAVELLSAVAILAVFAAPAMDRVLSAAVRRNRAAGVVHHHLRYGGRPRGRTAAVAWVRPHLHTFKRGGHPRTGRVRAHQRQVRARDFDACDGACSDTARSARAAVARCTAPSTTRRERCGLSFTPFLEEDVPVLADIGAGLFHGRAHGDRRSRRMRFGSGNPFMPERDFLRR